MITTYTCHVLFQCIDDFTFHVLVLILVYGMQIVCYVDAQAVYGRRLSAGAVFTTKSCIFSKWRNWNLSTRFQLCLTLIYFYICCIKNVSIFAVRVALSFYSFASCHSRWISAIIHNFETVAELRNQYLCYLPHKFIMILPSSFKLHSVHILNAPVCQNI